MLPLNLYTPHDVAQQIADNAKQLRLSKNMSRKTLALDSGVSLGSIQRFEQTGKISLSNLLHIAHVLSALTDFQMLLQLPEPQTIREMRQREKQPRRGRL
jgi:transcriptional regulator with XRE-family HTH domain